ncbi:MAG: ribonuclease D [Xanthomonadales bacterium]|jgi:ribonuclease D|nr:ribonuclease D [Xanthomonadales bacterium]
MSKTTIKKAIESAEHPILLETVTQLKQAESIWKKSAVLGIDTEFVRERTYRADLGLVQVSDGQTAWLFDPLALSTTEPLARMMENPGIIKLLHSGSEDLEVLLNALGVIPEPLVDTQMACAMLGQPLQLGYHHAVKWLFDVEIDKDQTRSNWCKRPLTAKQLRYAAMDVVLLPEMLVKLRGMLDAAGRWTWLQEDVARVQRNARQAIDPDTVYQRFPGIGRMDQDTLQVLKYLARWREETAIERNRARGFVIADAPILQMAREKPVSKEQLQAIEGIHPIALSRYAETLLKLIELAGQDRTPVETLDRLDDKQRSQLNQMRAIVAKRAADLGVEPALLASRRELERLIRAHASDQPVPERFLGWRKQEVTDELVKILDQ